MAIVLSIAFGINWIMFIFKPLLMPLLVLILLYSKNQLSKLVKYISIGALLFAWLGDIALLFGSDLFFIAGLTAFLLAHVCYIFVFYKLRYRSAIQVSMVPVVARTMLIVFSGGALYTLLYPSLGQLSLPVGIYVVVILGMVAMAIWRRGRTGENSYFLIYAGALLFIISDAIIAITRFSSEFEFAGVVVMSTYILAQFLIVKGIIAHQAE
ncbi:MAG: lysoplasmalogenase [Cyclobacteriaceae bacterium]